MKVVVAFVGTLAELCPYGNLSNSDKVGTLSSGGSNLNLTILWWNAVGYISGPTHRRTRAVAATTRRSPGGTRPGS